MVTVWVTQRFNMKEIIDNRVTKVNEKHEAICLSLHIASL